MFYYSYYSSVDQKKWLKTNSTVESLGADLRRTIQRYQPPGESTAFLTLFRDPVRGITYQIGTILQIQLGANIEAMCFDRFNAAAQ